MDTFLRFLYEFLSQFFDGIVYIFKGLVNGFKSMFNIPQYYKIVREYKNDFTMPEWLFVGLAILVVLAILGLIVFFIVFLIRKYIRIRKSLVEQEDLLEEVSTLNNEVSKLAGEFGENYVADALKNMAEVGYEQQGSRIPNPQRIYVPDDTLVLKVKTSSVITSSSISDTSMFLFGSSTSLPSS